MRTQLSFARAADLNITRNASDIIPHAALCDLGFLENASVNGACQVLENIRTQNRLPHGIASQHFNGEIL